LSIMTEREQKLLSVIQTLRGEVYDCISFMETFDAESLADSEEEGAQRLQDKEDAVEQANNVLIELGLEQ